MAEVFLNVFGNGYATTDALPPMVEGETFNINFYPDPGEELVNVQAFDSYDYAVALSPVVNNVLTMQFRSGWGNLYVDIYFSGSTPPGPSITEWLIPFIKKMKDKRRKVD